MGAPPTSKGSTVEIEQSGFGGVPPPPGPPPPAGGGLPPGWREIVSDDGDTYYFNDDTGESQWDPPGGGAATAEPSAINPFMESTVNQAASVPLPEESSVWPPPESGRESAAVVAE